MPSDMAQTAARTLITSLFEHSIDTKRATMVAATDRIVAAAELLIAALETGHKILACGNGGSAGDAQHFSSELVNRFEHDRIALPALALTTDSSTLTAIANDAGYDRVFVRQIEALGNPGDPLLAFSTSGNSASVVAAVETAHEYGLPVIAITGRDGGTLGRQLTSADIELRAIADSTARIQETHLLFIHCLCRLVEDHFRDDRD